MVSRREAIVLCGCAFCLPQMQHPVRAQEFEEANDAFFFCDTPQISTSLVEVEDFGGSGEVDIDVDTDDAVEAISVDDYATATRALRWTRSKTRLERNGKPLVMIGFLDGTASQQDEVVAHAQAWRHADIGLDFDFSQDLSRTHVRISFAGGTNKSKTGIEALDFGPSSPTMWLPDIRLRPRTSAARRAVLHEFGHGLMAFGHEHRHADAGYRFKPAAQIRDMINQMLPPGSAPWTVGMVETNITNPPYASSRTCSAYDTSSIMHYPVMSEWLVDGAPVPVPATTLSRLDLGCAAELYRG